MDAQIHLNRYAQVVKQRNVFVGLLCLTLGLNIVQVIERLIQSEKIILVPPGLQQTVWLDQKHVSDNIIEEWAVFISQLFLNVSSETIDYQRDLVLRHVSPSAFAPLKQQFDQDKQRLEKDRISTTFTPTEVRVQAAQKQATINGVLSTYVGKERVSQNAQTFVMTFLLKDWGHIQLCAFGAAPQPDKRTNS